MNGIRIKAIAALALSAAAWPVAAQSLDAGALLRRASDAIGAGEVKTLRYSGSGSAASFGQAYKADHDWPRLNLSRFERKINYETGSYSEETTAARAEPLGGGGGLPAWGQPGERRTSTFVSGGIAWNMAGS